MIVNYSFEKINITGPLVTSVRHVGIRTEQNSLPACLLGCE